DEDPALAVAADPVDAEDPGEADRLALKRDGPFDLGVAFRGVLEALFLALVGELAEARPPESPYLRLNHPAEAKLEMVEGRRDKGYAVPSHALWAEHQRVASAASGSYSRSALQRSYQVSFSISRRTTSTYAPSRYAASWPRAYST